MRVYGVESKELGGGIMYVGLDSYYSAMTRHS